MLQGQLDSVRDQEQKVLAWNKERQEQGIETICERWEDHGHMGTDNKK